MTKFFSPDKVRNDMGTSPARVYADCFLYEKLGQIMPKKEVNVLDVGCGSGYIREIFSDLGYKINYSGVDIKRHDKFNDFNKCAAYSSFTVSKIEKFNTNRKFDLVLSTFVLEHTENDVLAISKMDSFLAPDGVHLHMVPSFWSFFLYFKHGYRRYSPRRIKKLFKNSEIYRVGGLFSYFTHFILITVLKKVFKTTKIYESGRYPEILKVANMLDRALPILPIAYIILSFNKNENPKI